MVPAARCVVALLLAFGVSCGDEGADESPLVGSWYTESPDRFDCLHGYVFEPDGTFEYDRLCSLAGGGYGMAITKGKWMAHPRLPLLYLEPTHSTCRGASSLRETVNYEVEGDSLRFLSSERVVIFARTPSGNGANGVVDFGCFDQSGAFTQGPLFEL